MTQNSNSENEESLDTYLFHEVLTEIFNRLEKSSQVSGFNAFPIKTSYRYSRGGQPSPAIRCGRYAKFQYKARGKSYRKVQCFIGPLQKEMLTVRMAIVGLGAWSSEHNLASPHSFEEIHEWFIRRINTPGKNKKRKARKKTRRHRK